MLISHLLPIQSRKIPIRWVKTDEKSFLSKFFVGDYIKPRQSIYSHKIEIIAKKTNTLGAQPLWEGYKGNNRGASTRKPDEVRTEALMGDLFTYLVQERKPNIIVEFGTAFGVSGMYFLAGINTNNIGKLLTFDPNEIWIRIATNNLLQISDKFEIILGTFEDNIDNWLPQGISIDMAFMVPPQKPRTHVLFSGGLDKFPNA